LKQNAAAIFELFLDFNPYISTHIGTVQEISGQ